MLLLPDDVGRCLPLLCQKLWVTHDLFQEADHLAFELTVSFKVLWEDGWVALAIITKLPCSTLGPGQRRKFLFLPVVAALLSLSCCYFLEGHKPLRHRVLRQDHPSALVPIV